MKDYIREGLRNHDAPPKIYENICKALAIPCWTDEEREELLRQRDEAEAIAIRTKDMFEFNIINKD